MSEFSELVTKQMDRLHVGPKRLSQLFHEDCGLHLDERRASELKNGKYVPPDRRDVEVLERILELSDRELIAAWELARSTKQAGRSSAQEDPVAELGDARSALSDAPVWNALPSREQMRKLAWTLASAERAAAALPDAERSDVDAAVLRGQIARISDEVVEMLDALDEAHRGRVHMPPDVYYDQIFEAVGSVGPGDEVQAVSALGSQLWRNEPDQVRYMELNVEAVKREVKIARLFVVEDVSEIAPILDSQSRAGIDVRTLHPRTADTVPHLDDCVIFTTPTSTRAYVAYAKALGMGRIQGGIRIVRKHDIAQLKLAFEKAWRLASEEGYER